MILIVILANIWVHWIMTPLKLWAITKMPKAPTTMKPFDCEICLSFWVTLVYLLVIGKELWYVALMSGLAYFLGGLVSRLFILYLNKFYARAIKRFF